MRCNIKLDFIYIYQGHRNRLCNTKTKLIMSKSPKYDLSAAISIYYPHIISQHLNVKQEREFRRQIFCVCGEGGNAFVPPSILWLRWTITLCQKSARGCTLTPCKYSINIKHQIEENKMIFLSPNFAVVCFRCQTWFHYLQLKAFRRSRSNNLNLKKKKLFFNAKPTQATLD